MALSRIFLLCLLVSCAACPLRAADENSPDARMRENLRNAILQLRAVAADRDNFQAQASDLQDQVRQLTAKVAALTAQSAADRGTAARKIAELQDRLSTQGESIAYLQKSLDASQTSLKQATAAAADLEGRQAKLTADNAALQKTVTDEKTRNAAMLELSEEILARYQKENLGEALLSKERFIGFARTKIENVAQDYQHKLLVQRIGP